MILLSDTNSKVAHLSEDGKVPLCKKKLKEPLRGQSLGYICATKRCQRCPQDEFITYFDMLRRGIAYSTDKDFEYNKKGT